MASHQVKTLLAAVAASSMMLSSTVAIATPAPSTHADPWAVLTAMTSGAPAAAMCGTATAATSAQSPGGCVLPAVDAAPPPPVEAAPPLAMNAGSGGVSPLILALLAIAAGVGIYLALNHSGSGNSPA